MFHKTVFLHCGKRLPFLIVLQIVQNCGLTAYDNQITSYVRHHIVYIILAAFSCFRVIWGYYIAENKLNQILNVDIVTTKSRKRCATVSQPQDGRGHLSLCRSFLTNSYTFNAIIQPIIMRLLSLVFFITQLRLAVSWDTILL